MQEIVRLNAVGEPQAFAQFNAVGEPEAFAQFNAVGEPEAFAQFNAVGEPEAFAQFNAVGEPKAFAQFNAVGEAKAFVEYNAVGVILRERALRFPSRRILRDRRIYSPPSQRRDTHARSHGTVDPSSAPERGAADASAGASSG